MKTYYSVTNQENLREHLDNLSEGDVKEYLRKRDPKLYSVTEWYGDGGENDEICNHLNGETWLEEG